MTNDQASCAEVSTPDIWITRRERPQLIVRVFDHRGHCDDQGIERLHREITELLKDPFTLNSAR